MCFSHAIEIPATWTPWLMVSSTLCKIASSVLCFHFWGSLMAGDGVHVFKSYMYYFWISKPFILPIEKKLLDVLVGIFYYCTCLCPYFCHCYNFNPSLCLSLPFCLFCVAVSRPCHLSELSPNRAPFFTFNINFSTLFIQSQFTIWR